MSSGRVLFPGARQLTNAATARATSVRRLRCGDHPACWTVGAVRAADVLPSAARPPNPVALRTHGYIGEMSPFHRSLAANFSNHFLTCRQDSARAHIDGDGVNRSSKPVVSQE